MAAVPIPHQAMIRTDWELIDLLTGYQPAAVITTAHRIGLFGALRPTPRSGEELAGELDLDHSNLVALLKALVGLGLVEKTGTGYAATPYTQKRLGSERDMGLVVAKEAVFASAWARLGEVMVTGRPVMETWSVMLETHPEQARAFLEALDVLARIGGPRVEELDIFQPGLKVLDVGGGLGTYARRMAQAGAAVTLVDYPKVAAWAEEELSGSGVQVIGVDLFDHPSCGVAPDSMDLALVSHLVHDLTEARAVDLLGRVWRSLIPGGRVVVNDFAGESGPGAFGPLFDLMMRVETGGAAHSHKTLESMLAHAGFVEPVRMPYEDPLTVYVAIRPGNSEDVAS
ncbi:MAG: methyltransferase domain-containing protein [Acidimicrobiia bacterium]|nr:methyltransferase domain-containing protein [Acidimicrobiia bacterium]